MEILIFVGILALVLVSAGGIYFVFLLPNQKSFDEVKEEQKKKNDAEKKAALQEARERAMRAKEKKRQKKAAAKEDKRLNSLSTESDGAMDTVAPVTKTKEQQSSKDSSSKSQNKQQSLQVNIKINLSETKSVSQNAGKQTKSEGNEKKNSSKGKGNVEVTNSKENNEKSKPEPKKKKAETVLSENNQNVANVPKAPIKEKGSNDTAKVAPTDPPKEQRAKREAPAKKAQGEQPVVKKEPKVVDVKPKAVQQKAPSVEQAPPVKEEPKVAVMPKEIKKQISSVTSSPASAKGGKKKKSDLSAILALGNDKEALGINVLMPLVAKAELSNTEIEAIIEVLLNKQTSGTTDWTEGRQDPLIKLRKQLEEKEKLLVSEKEISKGIQAKLTELRSELNGEKHKVRHLEDTVNLRTSELQSYAMRIKQLNDEKVHQTQQLQSKLNEEHLILCQLKEQSLKDECAQAKIQQDFVQQIQSRDMHIARLTESLSTLEAQISQMAVQLQEQEAINGGISEEVNVEREQGVLLRERLAFQDTHIAELGAFRTELEHRLGQAQFEINRLQAENKTMVDQLNAKKGDQESQVKALQAEINTLQETNERLLSQVSSASEKAQQLKNENDSLTAQVTANTERPAAEGRENDDETNNKEAKNSSTGDSKYLSIIEEKESNIESLKKELNAKDKDLTQISAELSAKKTEVIKLSKDIAQQESIVTSLRSELGTSKSTVSELTAQVDAQKKKNDELRNKNYSIMEGLSKTEKALETKVKQSQELLDNARVEAETQTRAYLSRLFPQVAPKSSKDVSHKAWLEKFEAALAGWIEEKSNHSANNGSVDGEASPAVLSELEKQNTALQAMVTNYKSIITDTEGMLNKLQARVETEETRWNAQIESLTLERDQLEEQVRKLASNVSNTTSSYDSKDLAEEVKILTSSLEEEKAKTAEATKEIQKLKSQLKIGFDSLQAEQKSVELLEAQVAQLKKTHNEDSISIDSNGLNNNEVGFVKN
ncbi:hypothetical protein M8J75_011830 [Diaphorina citri]|nr:hypothetical protein M8J75_011830 [Diaphorina citri]